MNRHKLIIGSIENLLRLESKNTAYKKIYIDSMEDLIKYKKLLKNVSDDKTELYIKKTNGLDNYISNLKEDFNIDIVDCYIVLKFKDIETFVIKNNKCNIEVECLKNNAECYSILDITKDNNISAKIFTENFKHNKKYSLTIVSDKHNKDAIKLKSLLALEYVQEIEIN